MTPAMLPVRAAAERLGIDDDHVRRLIVAGLLRAVDVSVPSGATRTRRTWRIDPTDLEDFVAGRTTVPPTPTARRRRKYRPAPTVTQYF
ncbi:MAG TPA: helix-turn-helix domain-containing protein [Fimbriiglobus sp.]|jgi:hypothetical protein